MFRDLRRNVKADCLLAISIQSQIAYARAQIFDRRRSRRRLHVRCPGDADPPSPGKGRVEASRESRIRVRKRPVSLRANVILYVRAASSTPSEPAYRVTGRQRGGRLEQSPRSHRVFARRCDASWSNTVCGTAKALHTPIKVSRLYPDSSNLRRCVCRAVAAAEVIGAPWLAAPYGVQLLWVSSFCLNS